jgi:starvation-inducible DNA-binding protein
MVKTLDLRDIRMFATEIDLSLEAREELVSLLNQQLADSLDLYSQAKHAHWNVKGTDFFQLHKLFDELAGMLEEFVDIIAERATALGGTALGTVRMASAASSLPDMPLDTFEEKDVLHMLIDRVAAYAASSRQAIDRAEQLGDMASNDLFIDVTRAADKFLYLLESHVQG